MDMFAGEKCGEFFQKPKNNSPISTSLTWTCPYMHVFSGEKNSPTYFESQNPHNDLSSDTSLRFNADKPTFASTASKIRNRFFIKYHRKIHQLLKLIHIRQYLLAKYFSECSKLFTRSGTLTAKPIGISIFLLSHFCHSKTRQFSISSQKTNKRHGSRRITNCKTKHTVFIFPPGWNPLTRK